MTRLGAHADADGVSFAVYSSVAESVQLCVDGDRIAMEPEEGYVWTARLQGAGDGLEYGYRVHGPGRCNPAKLLLDPYARAIAGGVTWHPAVTAHDDQDSAPYVPR